MSTMCYGDIMPPESNNRTGKTGTPGSRDDSYAMLRFSWRGGAQASGLSLRGIFTTSYPAISNVCGVKHRSASITQLYQGIRQVHLLYPEKSP